MNNHEVLAMIEAEWRDRLEAAVLAEREACAKTRKATLEEMIYEHPTIAIKKAVEYAVKEEREACAKTVETIETYEKIEKACFKFAAKTIRARGNHGAA